MRRISIATKLSIKYFQELSLRRMIWREFRKKGGLSDRNSKSTSIMSSRKCHLDIRCLCSTELIHNQLKLKRNSVERQGTLLREYTDSSRTFWESRYSARKMRKTKDKDHKNMNWEKNRNWMRLRNKKGRWRLNRIYWWWRKK